MHSDTSRILTGKKKQLLAFSGPLLSLTGAEWGSEYSYSMTQIVLHACSRVPSGLCSV